jgi:signal transduction histidine kinase
MTYPEFRKDILKLVDNIEHGARRISTFVANLREFSQNNGNRQKVWLDLRLVADKVLSICRSQVKKRVRNFEMDIPADQPPVFVEEYSLEQILLNLIVNAAQAADKQDSFVKLAAYTGGNWHDHTILTVTDNGCGMDENTMGQIFDPFFTTKSAAEGTGLGLYVCHNLAQSLGGRIEVKSRLGEGSTFSLLLPGKERRRQARPLNHTAADRTQPIGRNSRSLQKIKTLPVIHPVFDLIKTA